MLWCVQVGELKEEKSHKCWEVAEQTETEKVETIASSPQYVKKWKNSPCDSYKKKKGGDINRAKDRPRVRRGQK